MNVVVFSVHLYQLAFKIAADLAKQSSQSLNRISVEHSVSVFGYKDQMDVQGKYAMSAARNRLFFWHRPSILACMKRLQAYKFELRPNGEQVRLMRQYAGACRFVYNCALELQKSRYSDRGKNLSYPALCRQVTECRKAYPWLAEIPVKQEPAEDDCAA